MSDILTSTPEETISQMAIIEALRGVSSAVADLRKDMIEEKKIWRDMSNALIRMEAADHPSKIRENKAAIDALAVRLVALEMQQNKRDGAGGVWSAILKSPALAWVLMLAGAVWVFINNKGDL